MAFTYDLTTTNGKGFPAFFHEGYPFTGTARNSQSRGAVMVETRHQHPLKLSFILGCHHGEIRNCTHVADVVLPLVGRTIGPNNACPIQNKGHRQFLNPHIVNELVKGSL